MSRPLFSFSSGVLELLHWRPGLPQRLVRLWVIVFFFYKFIYLFIFGCVGSSFLCEGLLQLRRAGATLHRRARASHCRGPPLPPPRCRAQAPDAQAQQLWLTGPVAPQHVGFSQTRARTRVPCIGRQTPNHCTTGEAQGDCLKTLFSRVSHTVAERGWSRFTGHCRVSSQDRGLHAYYLMHGWVRLLLGLLAHGAGSHRCYKALLSVDGCQIVVECRDM